jgi:hypothetical protein
MATKDRLADTLRQAELPELAERAAAGEFDDFQSVHPFPQIMLAGLLVDAGTDQALALRARLLDGEFDATDEEADAWAESDEGQETFRELHKGKDT